MKLNLGCGHQKIADWVNVDLMPACHPDVVLDLEHFPYPWEDDSVSQVILNHVLEHLGQLTETYLKIIQELYRVCRHGAIVYIRVPHPRHDDFLGDPTHVRPITAEGMRMFDQSFNRECIENKFADTPLGIYLGVNFKITHVEYLLEQKYIAKIRNGELTENDALELMREHANICKQIDIEWVCIKE